MTPVRPWPWPTPPRRHSGKTRRFHPRGLRERRVNEGDGFVKEVPRMAITADANALLLKSSDLGGTSGALIEVDVAGAGWEYTGLTVMKLGAGERWSRETGLDEVALVPLGGRCTVVCGDLTWTIGERANPFAGQPWAVYLPRDSA